MAQTDIHILKALLSNGPEFVSGNQLAQQLGISRVGVWARLEKLRDEQFDIEAVRHRGYRLSKEPDHINGRLIQAYLDLQGNSTHLHCLSEVDSTNSVAERLLANNEETPLVVISNRQTQGRGRMGRVWHSPDKGGIYASFAFRPRLPYPRLQTITLWLGLQICHSLHQTYGLALKVKWPNDLFLDGRKVAGMLTEARIDADLTRDLIFGVGLNVCSDLSQWPDAVAAVATTLQTHSQEALRTNHVAAVLINTVEKAYQRYLEDPHTEELLNLWQQYNYLDQRAITFERGRETHQGKVVGLREDGALLIQPEDGPITALQSGEVSLNSARQVENP